MGFHYERLQKKGVPRAEPFCGNTELGPHSAKTPISKLLSGESKWTRKQAKWARKRMK